MDVRQLHVGFLSLLLLAGVGALGCTLAQASRPSEPPKGGVPAPAKAGAGADVEVDDDQDEDDEEEVIAFDKAPEPVRASATKLVGDVSHITKVTREETDEDAYTYEVEYKDGVGDAAVECSALFNGDGVLMETERATSEAALPAAVLKALHEEFEGASLKTPRVVTKIVYEVVVVVDGKEHEVTVTAAGEIEDDECCDDEGCGGDDEHNDPNL